METFTLKTVFLYGPWDIRIEEIPIPEIGPGEILVEMKACGVCGTDIEKAWGKFITPPKLGHEVSGRIAEVGREVEDLEVGDKVFAHHHVPCYKCHYCRRGDHTMCPSFMKTSLDPCGFSEYFRVPKQNVDKGAVLKLPGRISYEEGTLIEPAACCLRGLTRGRVEVGDDVLVIGAGPIGLTMTSLLRIYGVHTIIVSEPIELRRHAAKKFGADHVIDPEEEDLSGMVKGVTRGRGADLAVIAVGGGDAITQGIDCVRRGGRVLVFGAPPLGEPFSYDASKIFINEVKIIPSYSTTEKEAKEALRLMESRRLNLHELITHTFPLSGTLKAIRFAAESREALKVLVKP